MKNVLFLINTLRSGGAEKVLVDLVNNLDPQKYTITVQTLLDGGVYVTSLSNHVTYKPTIKCKNRLIRWLLSKLIFYGNPKLIYSVFVRKNYDYEIAFLEGLPTKVISASTNKYAKKYAWVHIDLIDFPLSFHAYGSEAKEREAYTHFDSVFCVSEAVQTSFIRKYGPLKAHVKTLYNIIDDQKIISQSKITADLPTSIRPCLISVGRLTPQKGYDRLLRIHKRLLDAGLHHALIIIGEGELYSSLNRYICENQLTNSAFLLGFQQNPHMFVSQADLFVCSSYAEGYSLVITEAVLSGTPVVSTDNSGVREPYESPRCSLIVDNDEEALFDALYRILSSPDILISFRKDLAFKQSFFSKERLLFEIEAAIFP